MTAQSPAGLLVLGMHRSGTSALAGALHAAGWFFGAQLLPATTGFNPKGFFEDQRIMAIHDDLLASLGLRWYNCHLLPADWMASTGAQLARQQLTALLSAEFLSRPRWAVKDPRLSVFLPLWAAVLDNLDAPFQCLILLRHPAEVVASLTRRNQFSQDLGYLNWLTYSLAAELGSRAYKRQFVQYEQLVAEPARCLRDCFAHIGTEDHLSIDTIAHAVTHIAPELHHHHEQNQRLPRLISTTFDALCKVDHNPVLLSVLDAAYEQVQAFAPLMPNTIALESANLEQQHAAALTRQHVEDLEAAIAHWIDQHQQQVLAKIVAEKNLAETTAILLAERDQLAARMARAEADFNAVIHSRVWRMSRPARSVIEASRQVSAYVVHGLTTGWQSARGEVDGWKKAIWAAPHQLALKPHQDIGLDKGDYVCCGAQPLFVLISGYGILPVGRVRLSFDVTHSDRMLVPRIFVYRKDMAEPEVLEGVKSSKGRFSITLNLTPDVVRLGLAPFAGDGRLAIDNAQLKYAIF